MRREYVECDLCGKEMKPTGGSRWRVMLEDGMYGLGHPKAGHFKWREMDVCYMCMDAIIKRIEESDKE